MRTGTKHDKIVTIETMGSNPLGWARDVPEAERKNVFAVVIYIPKPLGTFLDNLRRELVPAYNPHAHVSVLPPRPLSVDWRIASAQALELMDARTAFDVELTTVGIFPKTDVVYIEVGKGAAELEMLHAVMNTGPFLFAEPFPYRPHITLAQEVPPERVAAVHDLACQRWREFQGSRTFRAERAVFVQNTVGDSWIDLAEYSLGNSVPSHA